MIFQVLLFLNSSLILLESENILCMILILLNLLRFVLWLRIRSFWMFHLPLKRTYNLLLLGGLFHKCQLSQLVQIFYIFTWCFIFYSLYAKIFLCCFILLLLCYAGQIFSITDILSIWPTGYYKSAVVDGASQVVQLVKNPPAKAWDSKEMKFQSLGREDPLEEEMQPTPVFLPGEFHGQRSLVGYGPWGSKESNTDEQLSIHTGKL